MDKLNLANGSSISLRRGDITTVVADAIVNAANAYLAAGGGVSGAIHKAAGPGLKDECDSLALSHGPLKPGEAVMTKGHLLPASHVIHALGPKYSADPTDAPTLARTYSSSIELADQQSLRSVAFPSISTGIFGYPLKEAARVAIDAVSNALERASHVRDVVFVLFEDATYEAYETELASRLS